MFDWLGVTAVWGSRLSGIGVTSASGQGLTSKGPTAAQQWGAECSCAVDISYIEAQCHTSHHGLASVRIYYYSFLPQTLKFCVLTSTLRTLLQRTRTCDFSNVLIPEMLVVMVLLHQGIGQCLVEVLNQTFCLWDGMQ